MNKHLILWADDEIDLLKPHIIFLEAKGYDIIPVYNGADALEKCREHRFDVVFLDENMPGLSGLETLSRIKTEFPNLPVVMITKSEEEHIMEQAIGSKIADYLIKPLNPNQILLAVKKILQKTQLIDEKTNQSYSQEFRQLGMTFSDDQDFKEWTDTYRKLVYWQLEIDRTENRSMKEIIDSQMDEANQYFCRYVMKNYENWLNDANSARPVLSHTLMKTKVLPLLQEEEPVFFIVIDNLRYDHWSVFQPLLAQYFHIEEEGLYYSILPTATQYARNAIFSGLMPAEIEKKHPNLWVSEEAEEGKNGHEDELIKLQLERNKLSIKHSYHKILNAHQGKNLLDQFNNLMGNKLNVIVYNFVDMLSHARTDMAVIRELAPDESAYRSVALSWFQHSALFELLKRLSGKKCKVVISTDHGTIRVKKPFKIVGDKTTNSNLRYKLGKNLGFEEKGVLVAKKPERFFLPKPNLSTAYVFATEDQFFAYPNNYNHYVNFYKDTFQHGGISMEEMMIPMVYMKPK